MENATIVKSLYLTDENFLQQASVEYFYGPYEIKNGNVDSFLTEEWEKENIAEPPIGKTVAVYSINLENDSNVTDIKEYWWNGNKWILKVNNSGNNIQIAYTVHIGNDHIEIPAKEVIENGQIKYKCIYKTFKELSKSTISLTWGIDEINAEDLKLELLNNSNYKLKTDEILINDGKLFIEYHYELNYDEDDNAEITLEGTPNNPISQHLFISFLTYACVANQTIGPSESDYTYRITCIPGFLAVNKGGDISDIAIDIDKFNYYYNESENISKDLNLTIEYKNQKGNSVADIRPNKYGNSSYKITKETIETYIDSMKFGEFLVISIDDGIVKLQETLNIINEGDIVGSSAAPYALGLTNDSILIAESCKGSNDIVKYGSTTMIESYYKDSILLTNDYIEKLEIDGINKNQYEIEYLNRNGDVTNNNFLSKTICGFRFTKLDSDCVIRLTISAPRHPQDESENQNEIKKQYTLIASFVSGSKGYFMHIFPNVVGFNEESGKIGNIDNNISFLIYKYDSKTYSQINDISNENLKIKIDYSDGKTSTLTNGSGYEELNDLKKCHYIKYTLMNKDDIIFALQTLNLYKIPSEIPSGYSITSNNDLILLDDDTDTAPNKPIPLTETIIELFPNVTGATYSFEDNNNHPFVIIQDSEETNKFHLEFKNDIKKFKQNDKLSSGLYSIKYTVAIPGYNTPLSYNQKIKIWDISNGLNFKLNITPLFIPFSDDKKSILDSADSNNITINPNIIIYDGTTVNYADENNVTIGNQVGAVKTKDFYIEAEGWTVSDKSFKSTVNNFLNGTSKNSFKLYYYSPSVDNYILVDEEEIHYSYSGTSGSNACSIDIINDAIILDDNSSNEVVKKCSNVTAEFKNGLNLERVNWTIRLDDTLKNIFDLNSNDALTFNGIILQIDSSISVYLSLKSGKTLNSGISGYIIFEAVYTDENNKSHNYIKYHSVRVLNISNGSSYNLLIYPNSFPIQNKNVLGSAYIELHEINDSEDKTITPLDGSNIKFYWQGINNNTRTSITTRYLEVKNLYKTSSRGAIITAYKGGNHYDIIVNNTKFSNDSEDKKYIIKYLNKYYLIETQDPITDADYNYWQKDSDNIWECLTPDGVFYDCLILALTSSVNPNYEYLPVEDFETSLIIQQPMQEDDAYLPGMYWETVCYDNLDKFNSNEIILDKETISFIPESASTSSGYLISGRNDVMILGKGLSPSNLEQITQIPVDVVYNGDSIDNFTLNIENASIDFYDKLNNKYKLFSVKRESTLSTIYITCSNSNYPEGSGVLRCPVNVNNKTIGYVTQSFVITDSTNSYKMIVKNPLDFSANSYYNLAVEIYKYSGKHITKITNWNDVRNQNLKLKFLYNNEFKDVSLDEKHTIFDSGLEIPRFREGKLNIDVKSLIVSLYEGDVLVDQEAIPVINDGTNGINGGTYRYRGDWEKSITEYINNNSSSLYKFYNGMTPEDTTQINYIDVVRVTEIDVNGNDISKYYQCTETHEPSKQDNPKTSSKWILFQAYEHLLTHTLLVKDVNGNVTGGFTGGTAASDDLLIWAGDKLNDSKNNATFKVYENGNVYAGDINLKGTISTKAQTVTEENFKQFFDIVNQAVNNGSFAEKSIKTETDITQFNNNTLDCLKLPINVSGGIDFDNMYSLNMLKASGSIKLEHSNEKPLIIILPYVEFGHDENNNDDICGVLTLSNMNDNGKSFLNFNDIQSLIGRKLVINNTTGHNIFVLNYGITGNCHNNNEPRFTYIPNNGQCLFEFVLEDSFQINSESNQLSNEYTYTRYTPRYYWKDYKINNDRCIFTNSLTIADSWLEN